jgi:alpha-ketoglutarate-dependent taurine dioxygenase
MVENKMSSVEENLVNREWTIALRNQLALEERQQLTVLRQKLSQIIISDQQQYEVFWLRLGNNFSVRSIYKFMVDGPLTKSKFKLLI